MTETDPPAGTWCNNGTVLLTGAQLAADPSSPTLTKDSTQQLNLLEKWEEKKKKSQTVLLLLPRLKSSWDKGYFWQFVFKYAMLQSQLSKCKLRCGCPS